LREDAVSGGDTTVVLGPYRLDRRQRTLMRDGVAVPLGGRALDTLAALAAAGGETVAKDALLDAVWPGVIVEENNLQVQISTLRRTLGEGWIVTVPGRGYRLVVPPPAPDAASPLPLPLPDRPSLAVLPFANLSGDPEQEYFTDGMVEDITTGLSRIGGLFVIARNSSFTYKGRAVDVKQVGRELGVRYLLEGSVRKAGGRVRITCQLIDAATAAHLWADRFDGTLDDIFDMQDRITASVVGAVEPSLRVAEAERAHAKPTENLDAYDLYLRALRPMFQASRESLFAAHALLERALVIDPGYSQAKAFLARGICAACSQGWRQDGDRERALQLAHEALADHRDDPLTLGLAGHALGFLSPDKDQALMVTRRAVELNPNSALLHSYVGWVHVYRCEPQPAIDCQLRAIRLSPRDPEMGYFLSVIAFAHLMLGDHARAESFAARSLAEMPRWATAQRVRIAALIGLGREEEARTAGRDFMRMAPDFCVGTWFSAFADEAFANRLRAVLIQAGLPP
jgi:adenylate cyclase